MSSDGDIEYSEIQSALRSIGLSAALIFGATLLSQGLGFLTRVVMARYLPVDGYGNVVIGLSVLNLFGIAALVGMPNALSRYLPRQETTNERRSILVSTFQIVGVFSLTLAISVYLAADLLAILVFGDQGLVWIIRIFAGILPFYAMFRLSLGGFRGYEATYPRIILQNVLRPGLQLAGIVVFVLIGYGTTGIAFAYGIAFVGVAASGAINMIAKHSDLIILGIYKPSSLVGIYDVTFKMAVFLPLLFTPALGYLFTPIMSRLDANTELQRMDELYTVMTRWLVVAAFPIFALLFMFPGQSLGFFFGANYQGGQTALRILLIGFMIGLLPGMTGNFLTAVGETKLLMFISTGTMLLNVVVNIVLIPSYGIVGAAIATASARTFNIIFQYYFIYRKYSVNPFDRKYIIPTILMTGLFVSLFLAPISFTTLNFIMAVPVAAGLGFVYIAFFLVTRSIYEVELLLVDELLKKIGVHISVSDYLQPFVR
ncbi:MAG: flippase [Halobacteriaceae archaeon]